MHKVINLAKVIQLSTTLSSLDYHKLYINECTMKYKRVVERYIAMASDQSMNTKETIKAQCNTREW